MGAEAEIAWVRAERQASEEADQARTMEATRGRAAEGRGVGDGGGAIWGVGRALSVDGLETVRALGVGWEVRDWDVTGSQRGEWPPRGTLGTLRPSG
jgi:hypothetical protein